MNKPATRPGGKSRWEGEPRWYLWDGGFFLLGRGEGIVPPHAHHAIQVVIAIDGTFAIRGKSGDWRSAPGAIVRPDSVHSYNPQGGLNAMFFVDPESIEGISLMAPLRHDITLIPDKRAVACAAEIRRFLEEPLEAMAIRDLLRHCVNALCTSAPPTRTLDERVTRVLASIRASDELRMSIEDAAAMAFLSPSRFAHLFKQQVGLPFWRYMLWRKLTRAMLVIGRERTIATAAHAADFADAAHLTRTFSQMVGIVPSVLMQGEFFEIPSPFEAAP